ncbi:MAG: S-adenosylmethionine:tRNA ribosyltransferase-isomerase [Gaiellaceae bacterium]
MSAVLALDLPGRLEAHEPPEFRGLARDGVRMLVASRGDGQLSHARFRDLPAFLAPGDLLVINTSGTLPAALPAERRDGTPLELHLSTPVPSGGPEKWVVELRRGDAPFREGHEGETLRLPAGASAELLAPYLSGARLWIAELRLPEPLLAYLSNHGHPIRYSYVPERRPLADYQTVFVTEPGSAEMPSAGRPFTRELLTALIARGVAIAPLVLHTGVSSLEEDEPPYPERFSVPAATARLVTATRRWGGRVIAVGTTVVRALETVSGPDGSLEPGAGWTRLVVTPERGVRAVDGILTGWHEPRASHLLMLEAVAGRELVRRSYRAALECGYLWHEFGDVHLVLP